MPDDLTPLGWSGIAQWAPKESRVLIVEDEENVRRSLERLVIRLGHKVHAVESAESADQILSSGETFEILLLDINLPKMTGVKFLRWALQRDPTMAVIMLTGTDDPEVALECFELGVRTYLVKPVDREFLRIALRDAAAMRKLLVERNQLIERSGPGA